MNDARPKTSKSRQALNPELIECAQKLEKSELGKWNRDAYRIARQVALSKHPGVSQLHKEESFQSQELINSLKGGEGLLESDKKLILNAVQNADIHFLTSLAKALELFSPNLFARYPVSAVVILSYSELVTRIRCAPTIGLLKEAVSIFGFPQVEARTIRHFCKKFSLDLAEAGPLGLPKSKEVL